MEGASESAVRNRGIGGSRLSQVSPFNSDPKDTFDSKERATEFRKISPGLKLHQAHLQFSFEARGGGRILSLQWRWGGSLRRIFFFALLTLALNQAFTQDGFPLPPTFIHSTVSKDINHKSPVEHTIVAISPTVHHIYQQPPVTKHHWLPPNPMCNTPHGSPNSHLLQQSHWPAAERPGNGGKEAKGTCLLLN